VKFVSFNEKLAKTLRSCFEALKGLLTASSRCLFSVVKELIDNTRHELVREESVYKFF